MPVTFTNRDRMRLRDRSKRHGRCADHPACSSCSTCVEGGRWCGTSSCSTNGSTSRKKNGAVGTTMRGSSRSAKRAPLMAYVPGPNQVREVRTAARGCCQHLRLSNCSCRPEMLVNGGLMPAASRSRSRSLATVRTVCEQHKRADLLWMLCAAPHGAPAPRSQSS